MKHSFIIATVFTITLCGCAVSENETAIQEDNSSSISSVSDGRTLMTPEIRDRLQAELLANNCDTDRIGEEFNFDEPTELAPYENGILGFRAMVPYNPAWGTEKYSIPPYDEISFEGDNWISFGSLGVGEGCGLGRLGIISKFPAKTAEEIEKEVLFYAQQMVGEQPVPEEYRARIIRNGDRVTVESLSTGFCDTPSIDVIRPDATYHIALGCQGGDEETFAVLRAIADSMTFDR